MKVSDFMHRLTLILVLMISSPGGLFAGITEDYGYKFLGTRTYDSATDGYIYDGWSAQDDGSYVSSELDIRECSNPYLFFTEQRTEKWISSDGVNFTMLVNKDKDYRLPIPSDTRFVKIYSPGAYIDEVVVVADIAYGVEPADEVTPEFLSGTYNADGSYKIDGEGRFTLELPNPVTDRCVRYLQVVSNGNGVSLSGIKVRCRSGKQLEGLLPILSYRCYLLPKDAEHVEVTVKGSTTYSRFQVRCKEATADITTKETIPCDDFDKYYDIDGDGLLENINGSKVNRPVQIYDGSWQFIPVRDEGSDNIDAFTGMNSNGTLYGVSQSRSFAIIDDIANPSILHQTSGNIKSVTAIDYNLDGQTDYYVNTASSTEHPLLTLRSDGSVAVSDLICMTPEEYAGERSQLQLTTGGSGVPGMGDMFGRDGVASTFNPSTIADINSDGLPDFLDAESGTYLLNTGDGRFVKSSFGNRVVLRDFDGDGINDILIWEYTDGNVKLYNGADTSKEPLLLFNNLRIGHLYCRDVDHDGDVDVVALINASSTANESYVLISENQGNNKFRRREHYVEERLDFTANSLVDLDADGKYELLGKSSSANAVYVVKIVSPSEVTVTVTSQMISGAAAPFPVKTSANGAWMIFQNNQKQAVKGYSSGSRPDKPTAPGLHFNAATRRLTVSWSAGRDAETPAADLTYELRIGTAPGLGDIAAAQSLPDGTRRCLRNGSNGYSTFAVYNVDSWPEGKVYISYQTVDADFSGSEFSEPAIFDKQSPACDFLFTAGNEFAAWVPVDVELAFAPVKGVDYEWNFGDAEVMSLDDVSKQARIRFHTAGNKEISLTVCPAGGGAETTVVKTIYVAPLHYRKLDESESTSASIDIDGDGLAELFGSGKKFLKENAEGKFEPYRKSFNTTTGISTFHAADVDGDGLADVFDRNNFLINYGDGDMEKVTRTAPDSYAEWTLYDFNNDGKPDAYGGLNTGDFLSVTDPEWELTPRRATYAWYGQSRVFYHDFNGDGLIDLAYIGGETDPDNWLVDKTLQLHIFENIDGYSFKPGTMMADITKEPALIDDLDGDGLADYVLCDASYNFGVTSYNEFIVVRWGSGTETRIQCPDGNPFREVKCAFDFNNDGMKDLGVSLQNHDGFVTIDPDTRMATVTEVNGLAYAPHARLRSGDFIMMEGVLTAAPNERPLPPSAIRSSQDDRGVVIEWNPGSDKETPVKGLRYNIAVKRKGMTGEGAYLISPLNGGDASVPLPVPVYMPASTKFTIPAASIPAGEYEVSIQAIDWQNDASEFSEVYNLTVRPQALIKLPTSGMVGQQVMMTILGNAGVPEINFGSDVTVEGVDASHYNVTWKTDGMKQIGLDGQTAAEIYIHPALDAGFTIAPTLLSGAHVVVSDVCSEGGKWEYSLDGAAFRPMLDNDEAVVESRGRQTVELRFNKAGEYIVRHTVSEPYGEAVCERTTSVESRPVEIAQVSSEGNHFKVEWNVASVPAGASEARIYKETSVYDVYEPIGEVPAESGEFVDLTSNSAMKSARYRLAFVMPYGETALSVAHKPMHVQINQGVGQAVNLVWSRYEGLEVASYRIHKGTAPGNMTVYDTLSGGNTSFTDTAGDAADHCYMVEMVASSAGVLHAPHKSGDRSAGEAPHSNVVWGRDAAPAILAGSIVVTPVSGGTCFDGRGVVALQARVLPANATISKVNWAIVDGAGNMEVDIYGNVTARAYGKATVRATAVDGSGVCGEIELENNEILLTWLEFTSWPTGHTLPQGATFQYQIKTEPATATETPVWSSSDPSVATVTQTGLVEAVGQGQATICVEGKGPGMHIDLPLTVTRPEGYVEVEYIGLQPGSFSGYIGDEVQFTAIIFPENATEPGVIWSVEPGGEDVAVVDQTGKVTIIGEGNAGIKAQSESNPGQTVIGFIYGTSGIDAVIADADGPWNVHTAGGLLLMKDATEDDIRRLKPGLYIIGRRTVYVTGK